MDSTAEQHWGLLSRSLVDQHHPVVRYPQAGLPLVQTVNAMITVR